MEKKFYLVRLYSDCYSGIWDEYVYYAESAEEIEDRIDVIEWGEQYEYYAVGSKSEFEDEEEYECVLNEYYDTLDYSIKEVSLPELKELGFKDGDIQEI